YWNGRPISLIVLAEPLEVFDGTPVSRIELIPPVHQRVYKMVLEHLGVVVGDEFDEFSRVHRAVLTGQQFQSARVDPVYVLFEDFTHVKFYRRSFFDVVEDEEGRFDGFSHVDDWVPQRLVTATGPNPLPRGRKVGTDQQPCHSLASTISPSRSTASAPAKVRPATRRSVMPANGCTNGCSPRDGGTRRQASPAAAAASTTPSRSGSLRGSASRSWVRTSSAIPDGTRTRSGRAGGATTR